MRGEGTTEPSEVDQCRCLRVWVPARVAPRPEGRIKQAGAPQYHGNTPKTTAAGRRATDEPTLPPPRPAAASAGPVP